MLLLEYQAHKYASYQGVIISARVCRKVVFSYSVCVCVSVWAVTFECFDIETSFLVWYYILTISRPSLSIKVTG